MAWFNDLFRRKESPTRMALLFNQVGTPQPTPRNYTALSKEGYQKNVTVFRAVNLIAQACAGIEWELYSKNSKGEKTEITQHELLTLLERPNPLQGRSAFFNSMVAYFSIAGNSYVHAVGPRPNSKPNELWTIEPQHVEVVPGSHGYPIAYRYQAPSGSLTIPVDYVKMKSPILHLKTFHPLNALYGMSPLEAALFQIDQQNATNAWNLSLLQNSATPSGVLTVEATNLNPTGKLSNEQFEKLKDQIENRYTSSRNAGRPMLLEGGLKWSQMSIAPKDMEAAASKNVSTRELANAFGVPPLLLNIQGDNTYANYKEARLAFYEDTVLPIMDFIRTELNNWLTPAFGENLYLDYDRDDIEALAIKREARYTALKDANFLTQNEKRVAAGYEELENWDVFVLNNEIIPSEEDPRTIISDPPPASDSTPPGPEDQEDVNEADDVELAGFNGLGLQVKLFNPINKNEKRKTVRRIQNLKRQLEADFKRDIEDDFQKLEADIIAIGSKVDVKTLEFAALKTVDDSMVDFERSVRKNLKRILEVSGNLVFDAGKSQIKNFETKASRKSEFKYSQFVEEYIKTRSAKSITEIANTTRKQVRDATRKLLAEYEADPNLDLPEALQKTFKGLTTWRAKNIARTETNAAANGGSLEAVRTLEIPGMQKEWVATIDDQTRDDSDVANHVYMNGTRVKLDEKFTVPPDADMDGPGDPSAPAEQICNCRCQLIYVTGD